MQIAKQADTAIGKEKLAVCPGETRGDRTCTMKGYRVCLQLLDATGLPIIFGDGLNWWQWSNQTKVEWDDEIRQEGGDHWCTCGVCTAEAIGRFGCDRLSINCAATDRAWIVQAADFQPNEFAPLKKCFEDQCSGAAAAAERLFSMRKVKLGGLSATNNFNASFFALALLSAMSVMGVLQLRRSIVPERMQLWHANTEEDAAFMFPLE